MIYYCLKDKDNDLSPHHLVEALEYYGFEQSDGNKKRSYFVTPKDFKGLGIDTDSSEYYMMTRSTMRHRHKFVISQGKQVDQYELVRFMYSKKYKQLEQIKQLKKELQNG